MKLLLDSDFLFGLFAVFDPHHKESTSLLKKIQKEKDKLVVLNLVIQETATVLSRKDSQKMAINFLDRIMLLPVRILMSDEGLEAEAWKIFRKQTKKRTSFIDCANIAVLEKYKLDGILSFDEFYPKNLKVTA